VVALTCVLHAVAGFFLTGVSAPETPSNLTGFVVGVFLALFFLQALLWRACHDPFGRRLYVHALNGFYLGTIANRLLGHL